MIIIIKIPIKLEVAIGETPKLSVIAMLNGDIIFPRFPIEVDMPIDKLLMLDGNNSSAII